MSNQSAERPVRFRHLLAYGLGDLFGGGSFLVIGMLYMFFLTESAGLSPTLAGLVFAVGKGWDAISDPLMGYLSDRTESRFGRRRIYFLAGIIPIFVSFFLMWIRLPSASTATVFAYYSLAYMFFSTVFTVVMVPYAALNADMTSDFQVRSRLSGSRMVFSGIAALLGGTLPHMIIRSSGYLAMAGIFGCIFALPFIAVFLGTWELPHTRKIGSKSPGVFREFLALRKNRSFRFHIFMYIASYTAMDVLMALFAYFLTYYLKKPEAYSIAMGSLLITQILMFPLYVAIGNRKGKGMAYALGLSVWLIGMGLSSMLKTGSSTAAIAVVCGFIGAGTSAGVLIPWAILPSVIDVDEMISGTRRAGLYSGAMTLLRKLVQGLLAMPLIGVVLDSIGFISNQAQSPEVLERLKLFFFLGPMIVILLGIISSVNFRITPKKHSILMGELNRLKGGGSSDDVEDDVRTVCEELTGQNYETLAKIQMDKIFTKNAE